MSIPLITTDSFIRLKTIKRLLQYGNSLFENKFTTSSTDVFASIFELEMSSWKTEISNEGKINALTN